MDVAPSACYDCNTGKWLLNFKRQTTPNSYSTTDVEYLFNTYPKQDLEYLLDKYTTAGYAEKIMKVNSNETIQVILSKKNSMMTIISTNKQAKKTRLEAEYILTDEILNILEPLEL
jgi:hypothetical protein